MKRKYRYFQVSAPKIKIRFYDFETHWVGKWKSFTATCIDDYENFVDVRQASIEGFLVQIEEPDINPITGKPTKKRDYFLFAYPHP